MCLYHICTSVSQVRSRGLPDDHAGPIRIIDIEGVDANMCCGTHVSNLSHLQVQTCETSRFLEPVSDCRFSRNPDFVMKANVLKLHISESVTLKVENIVQLSSFQAQDTQTHCSLTS